MSNLTWFLEGNLHREFTPRRMLIVYETSIPSDIVISFKAPKELVIKSSRPDVLFKKDDVYFWRPSRDVRFINGHISYLYSVHLDVGGSFLSANLKCKVENKIYEEDHPYKNLKIRYLFSYKELDNVRLIIGPFKPFITILEKPKGSLRKWNIQGIGEVYFLTFDALPSSLDIEYKLPKYISSVVAARIEGESPCPTGMEIKVLNADNLEEIKSLEGKGRIIAYLEDLFL